MKIDRHVLPEVGELQSRASGVGKPLPLLIGMAAQVEHQAAHRIRRIAAISQYFVPVAVARDGLILHESLDQVGKRLAGNSVLPHRIAERHKHRMRGAALVHGVQFGAPPVQQAQAFGAAAHFIAQVVGPAAIRVDVIEILVEALGEQEAHHVEVLVVVGGQPAGVIASFGGRVDTLQGLRRADELDWRKRHRPRRYGTIAAFRWPLWLIRWRMTSRRLASGSSRLTKNAAVMWPAPAMSRALAINAGGWVQLDMHT